MKLIKVAALLGVGLLSGFLIGLLVGYDLELSVYSPSELEEMTASGDFGVGASMKDLPKVKPRLIGRSSEEAGKLKKRHLFYDSDSAVIITSEQGIVTNIVVIGD